MRVNLRKANKIRKEIEALIAGIHVTTNVRIDPDEPAARADPLSVVAVGRSRLETEIDRYSRLSGVLARLRVAINAANAQGVDAALAEAADLERQIKLLTRIVQASPRKETKEAIKAKVERAAERMNRAEAGEWHPVQNVEVSVLDQSDIEKFAASLVDLRRKREAVEDRRVALNASTEIEIGEEDEKVLRDFSML